MATDENVPHLSIVGVTFSTFIQLFTTFVELFYIV